MLLTHDPALGMTYIRLALLNCGYTLKYGGRTLVPVKQSFFVMHEAVIICTRNRPESLERTLRSVQRQHGADSRSVFVVDASSAVAATRIQRILVGAPRLRYLRYPGTPSATCQRNYGIEHLPASVEFVHFLDDDVTVHSGYFTALVRFLNHHQSAAGAGARIDEPQPSTNAPSASQQFFLHNARARGIVLPSGHTTSAQQIALSRPVQTDWLSGCASTYRRVWVEQHRFDDRLIGYAPGEDLDFSYRIGQEAPLYVVPDASLTHHRSPVERLSATAYHRLALIHRYWFVQKNIDHPLRYPAFWWATFGQLLA